MKILIFSTILIFVFGLFQILFFRFFNKDWWEKRWIRRASLYLPVFGIISVLFWGIGEYNTQNWLIFPGAIVAILTFIIEFCLILSLPISGMIKLLSWLFNKIKQPDKSQLQKSRRTFLKSASAAVPLFTLSLGAGGVVRAMSPTRIYRRPVKFNNLPPQLEGLKIFHLSDIHLHHYVTLSDLEDMLLEAEQFKPDLTLVTGDIADNLLLLPDALKMIEQLNSPLGSYAILGNHEYFRGAEKVKQIFGKSNTPLFIDQGTTIQVNDFPLFIGGIDDPRAMGAKEHSFFRERIDKTLLAQPSEAFSILMSHRPDALDYAAEVGLNLVLAGHTHGGQIGFNGRSLFESNWPDRYLWGEYRLKNSLLYTSSGAGHWFPFRLGCPAEAPVITLEKA